MEKQVGKQLQEAGIDASDEIISEFCDYLKKNKDSPRSEPKKNKKQKQKKYGFNQRRPSKKPKKMGPSSKNPTEMNDWEDRLNQWENKVQALELQLDACEKMQSRAASQAAALKKSMKNDPLRAYPYLRKDVVRKGGFIHPPTYQESTRMRFPIYKNEMYYPAPDFIRQLRASEAKSNGYIPGPMNRQDSLRWKIRERIMYSHPDYFIQKH